VKGDETQIDPKGGTYYELNKEARKAYQRAYYKKNRKLLARKRELQPVLDPERAEQIRQYQHEYYLTHRQELLAKRKMRERRKKLKALNPESGVLNPETGAVSRKWVRGIQSSGRVSGYRTQGKSVPRDI
jgi:hypothetical protein